MSEVFQQGADTLDNIYINFKGYRCSISSHSRHLKKPFRFGEKTIIVIDDEIVKQLGINDTTWLEQEATDSGILMKVKTFTTEDKGDEMFDSR
jgi:hypothetical protein